VSKAKELYAQMKKHIGGTGGGPPIPAIDPVIQKVMDICKDDASFQGLPGGFETSLGINKRQKTDICSASVDLESFPECGM
jgi:hypothetical protein